MALDSTILVIKDPAIPLRELSIADTTQPNDELAFPVRDTSSALNQAKAKGQIEPHAQIGQYIINSDKIEYMIIDETGFLPKITFMFNDRTGIFGNAHFPKRDIVLSVYLKSTVDELKPIRCDYLITSIRSLAVPNSNTKWTTYTIKGELFVPELYNNVIKSYSSKNSHDTLKEVSDELKLGFAQNESAPSDNMTWINPNWNREAFIKYVIKHSYKNDDSFFTSFIDKHYHLNYININTQFSQDEDIDKTVLSIQDRANFNDNTPNSTQESEYVPNVLSNNPNFRGSKNFIIEYNLISDQGKVLINKGYNKRIYYYDQMSTEEEPKNKLLDFSVRPISTGQTKFGGISLIPIDEALQKNEIRKWTHVDYGNTHRQYIPARLINSQNLAELNKIKLRAKIKGINTGIVRGSRIPVWISIPEKQYIAERQPYLDEEVDNSTTNKSYEGSVTDDTLTDFYYVTGLKHIFERQANPEDGYLFTEYFLSKRDWKENPDIFNK